MNTNNFLVKTIIKAKVNKKIQRKNWKIFNNTAAKKNNYTYLNRYI
jgi:hypothetical protein